MYPLALLAGVVWFLAWAWVGGYLLFLFTKWTKASGEGNMFGFWFFPTVVMICSAIGILGGLGIIYVWAVDLPVGFLLDVFTT